MCRVDRLCMVDRCVCICLYSGQVYNYICVEWTDVYACVWWTGVYVWLTGVYMCV